MHFTNDTSISALSCALIAQPSYTTVYETALLTACETSSWMATYTITETCHGDRTNYVAPTIPPGFVVTTVNYHGCHETAIEITCPGAQPTVTAKPAVQIAGSGITATITVSLSPVPATQGTAAPTGRVISSANVGVTGSNGSWRGCGGSCGNTSNGTVNKPPVPYTGTAASLGRSLMVGVGLTFLAVPFALF